MSQNKFPKLFVTDLDGTALGGFKPYSRFPDEFAKILDELHRKGCKWATNTTWDVKSQVQLVYASSITSRPSYLVGGSGLQLYSMEEDELIKVVPYSNNMEQKLQKVCNEEMYSLIRDVCGKFDAKNMFFNGFWFAIYPKEEQISELFSYVRERYSNSSRLIIGFNEKQNFINAHPAFMKKGEALKEIMRIENLTPEDVVVAGDEAMDLEMMTPELARYLICPNNASDEVKKRVLEMKGVVGKKDYGPGVVEAFKALEELNGW